MPGQQDVRPFSNDPDISMEQLLNLLTSGPSLEQKRLQQSLQTLNKPGSKEQIYETLPLEQLNNLIQVFKQDEDNREPAQYLPATARDKAQHGGSLSIQPFDDKPRMPLGTRIAGNEVATTLGPFKAYKMLFGSTPAALKNLGFSQLLQLLTELSPVAQEKYNNFATKLQKQILEQNYQGSVTK